VADDGNDEWIGKDSRNRHYTRILIDSWVIKQHLFNVTRYMVSNGRVTL